MNIVKRWPCIRRFWKWAENYTRRFDRPKVRRALVAAAMAFVIACGGAADPGLGAAPPLAADAAPPSVDVAPTPPAEPSPVTIVIQGAPSPASADAGAPSVDAGELAAADAGAPPPPPSVDAGALAAGLCEGPGCGPDCRTNGTGACASTVWCAQTAAYSLAAYEASGQGFACENPSICGGMQCCFATPSGPDFGVCIAR